MEKILIEILRQKFIVSNVILAFLDHLKPKIFFFSANHDGRHRAPPLSKSLDLPLIESFFFQYLAISRLITLSFTITSMRF